MNGKKSILIVVIVILLIGAGIYFESKTAKTLPSTTSTSTPLAKKPPVDTNLTMKTISIEQHASSSPDISIAYPQFPTLPDDINSAISSAVNDAYAQFKKDAADNQAARIATADPKAVIPDDAFSFNVSWEHAEIDNKYVSIILRFDSYTGGANEGEDDQTFNYDIAHDHIMALVDLFPGKTDYLAQISKIARIQLTASMNDASDGNVPTEMLNAGTEPTADNFSDFTFTPTDVTIYFPKYAVAPGSFGEQKVTIARSEIK